MDRLVPGLLAILVVLSLAFAASAQAADPVTNQNDSGPGSLRNAILTANPAGDTIDIPSGNYGLSSGQLRIDTDLILQSTAGSGATTIQSLGNFRVLCITGGDVTLDGLTIHGGRASPGGNDCTEGHGGGISSDANILTVLNSVIQHNSASPNVSGGGGGIYATGDLFVADSIVRHNTATATAPLGDNGGGGIYWAGTGLPNFELTDSTVYENTATVAGIGSGGGGIYSNGPPTLVNVTVSGNRHSVSGASDGGGGGILTKTAGGSIQHATFVGNQSARVGGAMAGSDTTLENSLFHSNTAQSGANCEAGAATTADGNAESTGAPTCDPGAGDLSNFDPQLGPLAENGSLNRTLTHEIIARANPAVEFATDCPIPSDQRGVDRAQFGANCTPGAFEFDGNTIAEVPPCSPTGVIPINLDSAPGGTVLGLSFRVDGGPLQDQDTGDSGGVVTPTSVTLAEGRSTLEYFGRWTNGVEAGSGVNNVLVDKTRPVVDVQQPQGQSIFVITRQATVNVSAADPLSGLTQDPNATGVPIDTGSRGAATVARTAADLCQNQATDSFDYRVLAPGLGIRTVLESVRGNVRVRSAGGGSGARASQKGRSFSALREPRELPIGSFIDARRGTTRLTSARTRREDQIQEGLFSAGLFQVLQSRRRRAKGLTEVRLKGGNFRRCRTRKGGPGAAQVRRRVIRRLNGNSRGRFRTRGRHSAATVRGTVWQVIDRCDGTLTKVRRGRVAVRDFRRKKTIIVRAGKSYLARAPR